MSLRRQEKAITDQAELNDIIRRCQVCRLALAVDNEPYLLPVSFGFDGEAIYLHTALEGRKIGFFERNPRVCFGFETDVTLRTHAEEACRWSMNFVSVVGYGRIAELVSEADKARGLNLIMEQYSGRSWEFTPERLASTRVWRIGIEELSGKRSPAGPAKPAA